MIKKVSKYISFNEIKSSNIFLIKKSYFFLYLFNAFVVLLIFFYKKYLYNNLKVQNDYKKILPKKIKINSIIDYQYLKGSSFDDYLVPKYQVINNQDIELKMLHERWTILKKFNKQDIDTLYKSLSNFQKKELTYNDAYTISERICNVILFASHYNLFTNPNFKKKIKFFLKKSFYQLSDQLEIYDNNRTNNHVLNNLRAIILIAIISKNKKIANNALDLLIIFMNLLFENGSLREGSSHYQLLVTKWLLDINEFLEFDKFYLSKKKYNTFLSLLTEICSLSSKFIYLIKDNSIYIGDISPDINQAFLINQLVSFDLIKLNNFNLHNCNNWFLYKKYKTSILIKKLNLNHTNITSHAHNDFTSFVWSFNDKIILFDPGRLGYNNLDHNRFAVSSIAHNIILINDLPPYPDDFIRFNTLQPNVLKKNHLSYKFLDEKFVIKHNFFNRLKDITSHQRTIYAINKGICIQDLIKGKNNKKISLIWNIQKDFVYKDKKIKNNEIVLMFKNLNFKTNLTLNMKIDTIFTNFLVNFDSKKNTLSYGKYEDYNQIKISFHTKITSNILTEFKI